MSENKVISILKANNIQLCYGAGSYPVSIAHDIDCTLSSSRHKNLFSFMKKVNRAKWF